MTTYTEHKSYLSALLLLFSFVAFLLYGCGRNNEYRTAEGIVWSTSYHIIYNAPVDLTDSINAVFNEVGSSLSVFDKNSLVSRVNSSDSVAIDSHFHKVYEKSKVINKSSDGMFDPTLSPLITAWGFGKGHIPTSDTLRLDSLLNLTGLRRTRLEGNLLIKENPLIQFNFSAIAKGYGADCVAEMLSRNGATSYLVEVGGEIAAHGMNPDGKPWRISIDSPNSKDSGNLNHESFSIVEMTEGGLATSGNYRNYHSEKNKRFGHTISPITGRPITTDIISATILASDCMTADAIATACMTLGSTGAIEMCKQLKCHYLLILTDMSVISNLGEGGSTSSASVPGNKDRN